jgi:hypothetical protein
MKHKDKINNDPTKREEYLRKEKKWRKSKSTSRLIEKDREKQRVML